eukprot:TRINITY_DN6346_c0_g2_i3.p1 TRINITY_DN6346_c0_g2~~TRINITY_DN6346_c0_g2_i3.p1  ORF type:complete len:358 (-),score=41.56 TRINITY_DN6346_c0_g2_i3:156-1229(-)
MKLGACYNLFDCEELLETSIFSIRNTVDHICLFLYFFSFSFLCFFFPSVVYQTTSNFGDPANPHLEEFLTHLQGKGLIDSLVFYEPRSFSDEERDDLITDSNPVELEGPKTGIGVQFLNEVSKRELGRRDCLINNCTHFFSIDADEYYFESQMHETKKMILENGWESTACRMKVYGKYPTVEYLVDNFNAVPFIHVCQPGKRFRIATKYPHYDKNGNFFALDPTRRIEGIDHKNSFHFFPRTCVEMHHMTLVRRNLMAKLKNVSNRTNYGDMTGFEQKWENWTPSDGVLHPHPHLGTFFSLVKIVPNYFNVDLSKQCYVCCKTQNLMQCSACKKTRYCSVSCQLENWPQHQLLCKPP